MGAALAAKQATRWMAPALPVFAAKAAPTESPVNQIITICSMGAGLPVKQATRWMAPALPVFAGEPAFTRAVRYRCAGHTGRLW
ncbi:hypothetical protein DZC31_16770 [Stenotrophomonas rhizophila]|nr:hypothetical protein DZC31_16770 [Stenotrophomonas rhizophila]